MNEAFYYLAKAFAINQVDLYFSYYFLTWCLKVGTGAGIITIALMAVCAGSVSHIMDFFVSVGLARGHDVRNQRLGQLDACIGFLGDVCSIVAVAMVDMTEAAEKDMLPLWLKIVDVAVSVLGLAFDMLSGFWLSTREDCSDSAPWAVGDIVTFKYLDSGSIFKGIVVVPGPTEEAMMVSIHGKRETMKDFKALARDQV